MNIYESEIINIIDRIESKEEMWKAILEISFLYENNLEKTYRRSTGIYYTNVELAKYLIDEMVEFYSGNSEDFTSKTILEPCVGKAKNPNTVCM